MQCEGSQKPGYISMDIENANRSDPKEIRCSGEVAAMKLYRSVYVTTLTSDDIEKANKELNETHEAKLKSLEALRELLSSEDFLQPRLDEDFLIRFLRARKFDVEATFQMLKKHYQFRRQHPRLFRCPSEVAHLYRSGVIRWMPFRDNEGRIIALLKLGSWDPDTVCYQDLATAIYIGAEFLISNPVTQINGFVVMLDYQGYGFRHAKGAPFSEMKHVINLFQGCFPARYKKFYAVNAHPLICALFEVAKFFLKKKVKERVTFTKELSQLSEEIDPQLLPVEYGGEVTFDEEEFIQKLMESNSEIERDRTYGYSTS